MEPIDTTTAPPGWPARAGALRVDNGAMDDSGIADGPGSEFLHPDAALLGWDDRLQRELARLRVEIPTAAPGRVSRVDRGLVAVMTAAGLERLPIAPALRRRRGDVEHSVAVGDWVAIDAGAVVAVLPRHSAFIRGDPERPERVRVVAANIDTVFVVHSLTKPLNRRRLERELLLVRGGGAVPVLVLTKLDLHPDATKHQQVASEIAPDVAVHAVSSTTGEGLEAVRSHAGESRSVALIGASGVGKSTIVNALLGREVLSTAEVRESDQRGRHTTTARQLVVLPGGGVLIDTPGLRSLALPPVSDTPAGSGEGPLGESFEDVEAVAASCRFSDCRHAGEPGCEVAAAVRAGRLRRDRVAAYLSLCDELAAGDSPRPRGAGRRGGR